MSFFDISKLQGDLNATILSIDSVQGLLMLSVVIGCVVCFTKRMTKFAFYGVAFLFLCQILHVFAFSSLGSHVPVLRDIFQYDVLQSIAQLFVGTPVATGLLYVQAFVNNTFGLAFKAVVLMWEAVKPVFEMLRKSWMTFSGRG